MRIGPNHLLLDGGVGWPEVFSHRKSSRPEYEKQPAVIKMTAEALISAPRDVHRRLRRQLAHAFSDSALLQQKAVIKRYTDRLLDRIQEQSQQEDIIDIVKWSKAATTDIIGDLTFSKPFGFIANSVHSPWVFSIFDSLREAIYRRAMQSFPLVNLLSTTLNINPFQSSINLVRRGVKEIAKQRLQLGQLATDERRDFMAYMMEDSRSGGAGMSADEILENSPSIIIAGSETTATALSGFWFYLSKHPDVYKTLAKEIRTSFCSEHEITMQRAAALEYLGACINEILRVYPPAAETPARVSPGDWFDGTYIPAGVSATLHAICGLVIQCISTEHEKAYQL